MNEKHTYSWNRISNNECKKILGIKIGYKLAFENHGNLCAKIQFKI